jgi:hypothetical protein
MRPTQRHGGFYPNRPIVASKRFMNLTFDETIERGNWVHQRLETKFAMGKWLDNHATWLVLDGIVPRPRDMRLECQKLNVQ